MVGGGLGTIVLALVAMYFGLDPSILINQTQSPGVQSSPSVPRSPSAEENRLAKFVSVVLADTEDTWKELFRRSGKKYREPTLVLYSGAVDSACGFASAAVGPFYCPNDQKLYIDLSFYGDLKNKLGPPETLPRPMSSPMKSGTMSRTCWASPREFNPSGPARPGGSQQIVGDDGTAGGLPGRRLGLPRAKSAAILEPGDMEEALQAASSIGDDRLQRQSRGYVTPDFFTHGSSAQWVSWFQRGIRSGDLGQCNTFKTEGL